jgi:hypothetical protein
MVDIVGQLNRIECFKRASIDKNGGNDQIDNSPDCNPFSRDDCNHGDCGQYRGEYGPEDRPKRFHFSADSTF